MVDIVWLSPDVVVRVDQASRDDRTVYCQVRRLLDGTLLVEESGLMIEGESSGAQKKVTTRLPSSDYSATAVSK